MLNDAQWERIAPHLSGKVGDAGSRGRDNRLFIDAVLWVARTGSAVGRMRRRLLL
jgi:putative transposase